MLTFQHEGLEIDSCPECFGLWFDREELKEFLQRPEMQQRLDSPEIDPGHVFPRHAERLCPTCQTTLVETSLGSVLVDTCGRCRGIWLDQGELHRAVEQYRQGQRGNLVVLNQIAEGLRARKSTP